MPFQRVRPRLFPNPIAAYRIDAARRLHRSSFKVSLSQGLEEVAEAAVPVCRADSIRHHGGCCRLHVSDGHSDLGTLRPVLMRTDFVYVRCLVAVVTQNSKPDRKPMTYQPIIHAAYAFPFLVLTTTFTNVVN